MKIITTVLRFGSINSLRFLAALCRFILVKKNSEKVELDCEQSAEDFRWAIAKSRSLDSRLRVILNWWNRYTDVHDQRIGPFKWPAEDEINFVASIRMKTFYYYQRPPKHDPQF